MGTVTPERTGVGKQDACGPVESWIWANEGEVAKIRIMISQRCPKCKSRRIRRGYRPTSIFLKIFLRYNLLCDGCNWEFKGFAVPGTVDSRPNRKKKRATAKTEVS